MNVNFSVFIEKILSGEKNQTIRRAGAKWVNVKPGDKLTLYEGLRTKQCRKLGEATVSSINTVLFDTITRTIFLPSSLGILGYLELADQEARTIAGRDGFTSMDDFWSFFRSHYGRSAIMPMRVIRWYDFTRQEPPEDFTRITINQKER